LQALVDLEFDLTLTGFSLAEVDLALDQACEASTTAPDKRGLIKELYRAWREAGDPHPRGYTFPSVRVGKRALNFVYDVLDKAREGGDVEEIVESEIEQFVSTRRSSKT
jgi:hypothetical protein